MIEWTRTPPSTAGDYWLCDDHWSDGEIRYTRVFTDLDGDMACVFVGFTAALKLRAVGQPSYWKPVEHPKHPLTYPTMPDRVNGDAA